MELIESASTTWSGKLFRIDPVTKRIFYIDTLRSLNLLPRVLPAGLRCDFTAYIAGGHAVPQHQRLHLLRRRTAQRILHRYGNLPTISHWSCYNDSAHWCLRLEQTLRTARGTLPGSSDLLHGSVCNTCNSWRGPPSSDNAVRCLFPVLWMTSCFHILAPLVPQLDWGSLRA